MQRHNKNARLLSSFILYCETHPDERFWQALRNWSRVPFIYAADFLMGDTVDTFYVDRQHPLERANV